MEIFKKCRRKAQVSNMYKNKYGLSRNIPNHIKRAVRQKCGFGCVICGLFICDFDHYAPSFSEAKKHNPDGITFSPT